MNNQQLTHEGLTLLEQVNDPQPIAAGAKVMVHRLQSTPQLAATLIAQRHDTADMTHANLVKLFEKVDHLFNDSELRDLCFRLNVNDEDLKGGGKRDKARELVMQIERHGRLPDLLQQVTTLRPKVTWQDAPQQSGGMAIISQLNVAIVVDIARPTIRDVARYLDEQETAVNFLLLKHTQPDTFLSTAQNWNPFVKAFSQAMNTSKHSLSGVKVHFFLSAPGALLFGLGCIWGTVDEAVVYHYEKGTYFPVIHISRELR
jgi:hypothetical protein